MRAFAFLRPGALDYLSLERWPLPAASGEPGGWLEPADGVRATRPDHLPWWLDDELWEVELAGDVRDTRHSLRADRGRLVRRIDAWDGQVAEELRDACVQRLRQRADHTSSELADDATRFADEAADPVRGAAVAAYVAAHAAGGGHDDAPSYEAGFDAERAWQADWLTTRLDLHSL